MNNQTEGKYMTALEQWFKKNIKRVCTNEMKTEEKHYLYRHPDVAKLCKEAYERGDEYFYPYRNEEGKIVNQAEYEYVIYKRWTPKEYEEFMKMTNIIS